jgi:hypothetical protein
MRGFLRLPLIACVLAGAPALAQEIRFAPALTLAEVYDDGLSRRSSGPAEALMLRLSPQLSSDYASARFFLLARTGFDAEVFEARSERVAPWARMGELQFRALATQRLTVSAGATYHETNIPRDLYAQTGFDPGLVEVKTLEVGTSAAYRLTPLANASVAYAFTRTAQGDLLTDSQSLDPALEEELGPRDKARLEVLARRLSFHGQFAQETVIPMLGWAHELTRSLSVALRGGPRFAGWTPDGVEASASLRAEVNGVRASLTYAATQMAVSGLVGAVNIQSLSAAVTCTLSDRLALSAAPSAFAITGAPLEAKSLQLEAGAAYRVSRRLALVATYRYSAQQAGRLSANSLAGAMGNRQVLSISASLGAPERARSQGIE